MSKNKTSSKPGRLFGFVETTVLILEIVWIGITLLTIVGLAAGIPVVASILHSRWVAGVECGAAILMLIAVTMWLTADNGTTPKMAVPAVCLTLWGVGTLFYALRIPSAVIVCCAVLMCVALPTLIRRIVAERKPATRGKTTGKGEQQMNSEPGKTTGAATTLRRATITAISLLLAVTIVSAILDMFNVGVKNWMLGVELALGVIVLILFVAWAKTVGAPARFWVLIAISVLLWIAGVVLELFGLMTVSLVCSLAALCLTIPVIVHDNRDGVRDK